MMNNTTCRVPKLTQRDCLYNYFHDLYLFGHPCYRFRIESLPVAASIYIYKVNDTSINATFEHIYQFGEKKERQKEKTSTAQSQIEELDCCLLKSPC